MRWERSIRTRGVGGMRTGAAALCLALLSGACGGDDANGSSISDNSALAESTSIGVENPDTENATPATEGASNDSGAQGSTETIVDDGSAPERTGSGELPADLCEGGQVIAGAIDIQDLVDIGVLDSAEATIDGNGTTSATTFNDFGVICNLKDPSPEGDDGLTTIIMTGGSDSFDGTAENSDVAPERIGDWDVLYGQSLGSLLMKHVDADGTATEFLVNWFPSGPARTAEEYVEAMRPFAELIASKATVAIPKLAALATPAWFACDATTPGVTGVDADALLAGIGADTSVGIEIETEIDASFDRTECKIKPASIQGISLTFVVQDPAAQLQDTLETYLAGWPDAVAETIAGYDVAVRIETGALSSGTVFGVIDGVPTEIRVTSGNVDLGEVTRSAAEALLSQIG